MATRWPIVVGAVAITGGIAWFAVHGRGSSPGASTGGSPAGASGPGSPPAGTGSAVASRAGRDGKIDLTAPVRPIHTEDPAAPLPAPETRFEAEDRDPTWAPRTEAEIKRRFSVGIRAGKLETTECRQDKCLLTMSGSEDDMSRALSDLETEGGLRGFADHIVLADRTERDGKLVIRAYAVFDRRDSDDAN